MEKLIELAQQIQDKELKEKVIDFLKNPKLTHKGFKKYPKEDIKKVTTLFTVGSAGTVERGDLISHTISVADLCMRSAEEFEKVYKIPINKDYLLAGAILHDIMKIYEWKSGDQGPEHTGILLDHSVLGAAELYSRGFPEQVIHIVAAHFGEGGSTSPRNFEALILHHVDTLVSLVEFHLQGVKPQQPMQVLVLDEETIKKMKEIEEKS
jgi:7,8-dihydroneopterin 2',3'-cyclic phosphate phosphodiesterase